MHKPIDMKQLLSFCLVTFTLLLTNCKKETGTAIVDCLPNQATTRQIINQSAVVKLINGEAYLVEQGAIDSRLKPCNLPDSLAIQDLSVTISGAVKASIQWPGMPCCTDNFVITAIRR